MNPALLTSFVQLCAPHATAQSPYGFTYIALADVQANGADYKALSDGGMIEIGPQNMQDGSYPARPTEQAVKAVAEWNSQPNITQEPARAPAHAHVIANIEVEDNVPLPEKKAFGRTSDGTSLVDQYPFNTLAVGQSFFVPQDAGVGTDKPKHRTFSSVVSQANKKFPPKDFAIREDQKNGVPGARVFRLADLTAPRPTRARKAKEQTTAGTGAPQATEGQPAFPGGFAAPGASNFGTFGGPSAPFGAGTVVEHNPLGAGNAFGGGEQSGGFAAPGGFPPSPGFPGPQAGQGGGFGQGGFAAPASDQPAWGAPAGGPGQGWSS